MEFYLCSVQIYELHDRRFVYAKYDVPQVINLKSSHISLPMLFFTVFIGGTYMQSYQTQNKNQGAKRVMRTNVYLNDLRHY
jgi:hypothetical protein